MNDPVLSTQGLSHAFAGRPALEDLSFSLRRGEILGLLGQNGAGKSTTLALIAGLLPLQAGRVLIQGLDRAREPLAANAALGFLPEPPPLHEDSRVDDFLHFAAALHGLAGARARQAVARELERLDLGGLRRRLIGQLSKGQRQRVGLAACLVHSPALVLLDEPSTGLDPLQQAQFRQLLRRLAEDAAVLLSSHQLDEVAACCERVLILHQGRLRADLPLAELRRPSLILGLREPPPIEALRELPGVLDVDGLGGGRLRLALARRDAQVYAAIAREIVARGWGLTELTPGENGLSSRFLAVLQEAAP